MIAITLVLVLSLITVSFAELMRREQRSALDKHLSTQAYYAAESGINDASQAIYAGFEGNKDSCEPLGSGDSRLGSQFLKGASSNQVGDTEDHGYTCLLIDTTPKSLEYTIGANDNKATQLSGGPDEGTRVFNIVVSWQPEVGIDPTFRNDADRTFPPNGAPWDATTGVIRVGLTPLNECVTFDRACLMQKNLTTFLYPNRSLGGSQTTLGSYEGTMNFADNITTDARNGAIIDGGCHADSKPLMCNVKITGISDSSYLLTLQSLYKNITLSLQHMTQQVIKWKFEMPRRW